MYQAYMSDSNEVRSNLNSLQLNALSSYYQRLSHKYLSSDSALDYSVRTVVDTCVRDDTISDYVRAGFLRYSNADKLQKISVSAIDSYHQNFKNDLDLGNQCLAFLNKLSDYNGFKFSDLEIQDLRTPVPVYNVNDSGYYMSSVVKGYDIPPSAVLSVTLVSSTQQLVYALADGSSVTSQYRIIGSNMELDSKMN